VESNRSRASRLSRRLVVTLAAVVLALLASCGDDQPSGGEPPKIGNTPTATPGSAAVATEKAVDQATGQAPPDAPPAAGGAPGTAPTKGLRAPALTADDFIDAPEHRDPFAPFEVPNVQATQTEPTTGPLPIVPLPAPESILFPDRELGDLQCRMILAMGGEKPRAYLVGPDNENAFVTQGEYVGRAIRTSANEPEVHWRVYEIEEGGVSFELSNATGQESETGVRPALRLYNNDEMKKFENLFSLR
jgi:hypothetical protein